MSLSSTSTIKGQLVASLGSKSNEYFETLQQFVAGKISRTEFEDGVHHILNAPNLIQLHNAMIISLFDATTYYKRPPSPPPDVPKPPPRKRQRVLPYQGPDDEDDGSLRSSRLKKWTISVGKRERDRLKNLPALPPPIDPPRPRAETDEIARERGVTLLSERGDPPGSRLPLHLLSITRAPTLQHITDKVNLVCAQNNLGQPSRLVASLVNIAYETHIKKLISHALTLSSTSSSISSIQPSIHRNRSHTLTLSDFETLFTISPSILPNNSAAASRLALDDGSGYVDDDEPAVLKDREVRDQRWQMFALLGERSTVKEALRNIKHV
ncbi:hypothetical protein PC9H_006219 [Pleurotus ostreatus]|uniref:Transcriptional regulator of RNA polII, SAGA, subunit-domain-containing protein n=2 Tax=Pleurotus ostreatus TaxID=5322 RepID=A0A067NG40_PLEO1|nr:uncharacterized protein PC9H_006219 [Pleurotus ostreatus]KAF7430511.1 hypothetical protein PC9H_006219 [Pleurotus ostreatus]KAJ8694789.1 hypothetical protein PTI98_007438 [Pleurotus ostreatus]KDQ27008.1 hypothetical protein PLEOSDRAFT_1093879 [Pleurotus ostreatus PC15]